MGAGTLALIYALRRHWPVFTKPGGHCLQREAACRGPAYLGVLSGYRDVATTSPG